MADLSLDETLPHWHDDPDLYDALFLGGERIAGVCTVEVERKRKVDKKSAKGKNKATVTIQGIEPAEVTIHIRVLDPADFQTLTDQMELFEPLETLKPIKADVLALDIAHWATKMRGITAIVVESMNGPALKDGILELTIKAVEFTRPPKAKGGVGGGGGLKIGTFSDQTGELLPSAYVAYEGPQARINNPGKPDHNKPMVDPKGQPIFVCQQKAIKVAEDQINTGLNAVFLGRFVAPDDNLRKTWEAFYAKDQQAKQPDVTTTPEQAKSADFAGQKVEPNAQPDPSTTDGGP